MEILLTFALQPKFASLALTQLFSENRANVKPAEVFASEPKFFQLKVSESF
jgi:hypothetical protein